jgi:hypothetical protein
MFNMLIRRLFRLPDGPCRGAPASFSGASERNRGRDETVIMILENNEVAHPHLAQNATRHDICSEWSAEYDHRNVLRKRGAAQEALEGNPMHSDRHTSGRPVAPVIFALLVCLGSAPSFAQLGPPSPFPTPSPMPLPNTTAPTPGQAPPAAAPLPSSPLPTPLPSTSPGARPAETFVEPPQSPEDRAPPRKTRSARQSDAKQRASEKEKTGSDADDNTTELSSDVSIPRLPSVFRNCEHPAPAFCRHY